MISLAHKKIFFGEQKSTGNGGYSVSKLGVGNRFLGYLHRGMLIGGSILAKTALGISHTDFKVA